MASSTDREIKFCCIIVARRFPSAHWSMTALSSITWCVKLTAALKRHNLPISSSGRCRDMKTSSFVS